MTEKDLINFYLKIALTSAWYRVGIALTYLELYQP